MELLSDAIPGSGSNIAGIIDRDILYDESGIPFIPSKRLKGILRENAEELEIYRQLENPVIDFFGKPGVAEGGGFFIDNGFLLGSENYSQLIKKHKKYFNCEQNLDYFTYIRAQTTITDNGVAKDNSLRISRVLKKGLKFSFDVLFDQKYLNDMTKICSVTRFFGSSRTRGFGEIKLELSNLTSNIDDRINVDHLQGDKPASIEFLIENQGQLLLSSKPGKFMISDDYISGQMIMGALASNYIRSKKAEHGKTYNPDQDENFFRLFLSGDVIYNNIYPIPKGSKKYYQPAPFSIKKVKEDEDNLVSEYEYVDHVLLSDENLKEKVIYKGVLDNFYAVNGYDSIYTLSLRRMIDAHHRRPANKSIGHAYKDEKSEDDTGEFFQFECLVPGNHFLGKIVSSVQCIKELVKYLPKDGIIRLGKSRTAQYGKCKIKNVNVKSEEYSRLILKNNTEEYFLVTSDMILLNKNGYPTPTAETFRDHLAEKLNVTPDQLKVSRVFVKSTMAGGFLGVWQLPRIQEQAIMAGTVIGIENKSGKDLQFSDFYLALGERIEEGYGHFMLYEPEASFVRTKKEILDSVEIMVDYDKLKSFIDYRIITILKREFYQEALKKENIKGPINNAFLSRMIGFIKISRTGMEISALCRTLKDRARKNLQKIQNNIFLKTDSFQFMEDDFKNACIQKIPSEFRGEFNLDNKLFELYKYYAQSYLGQLKLNNREAKS